MVAVGSGRAGQGRADTGGRLCDGEGHGKCWAKGGRVVTYRIRLGSQVAKQHGRRQVA